MSSQLLTLFTTCKPFKGEVGPLQRNAILTWRAQGLKTWIFGTEEGAKETAAMLGAHHSGDARTTEKGIPYVSSLFLEAEKKTVTPWLAYINADIMLQPNTVEVLNTALAALHPAEPTLLSFRRRNIPVHEDLTEDNWAKRLQEIDLRYGSWDQSNAIDMFVYTRGLFDSIPDLAVGHMSWDNWLMWKARDRGAKVIDGSLSAALLHPIHGYKSDGSGLVERSAGKTAQQNRYLTQGQLMTFDSATTHIWEQGAIEPLEKARQAALKRHCRPDASKELAAGLTYLTASMPLRSVPEIVDCCLTLLWRLGYYYPLLSNAVPEKPVAIHHIKCALNAWHEDNMDIPASILEDMVCHDFIATCKSAAATRPVWIWGAGGRGQQLARLFDRHALPYEGFIDSNAALAGATLCQRQILLPTNIKWTTAPKPFIAIGSMYVSEIATELQSMDLEPRDDYAG